MSNLKELFKELIKLINKRKYFVYFALVFIMLASIFASHRSFNKVDRPFTHRVGVKNNPNGWQYLNLKEKIAQLIVVRIRSNFYNSESDYKRNLKKWISEDGVGGVILFTGNGNVHGTYHNIKEFQKWAKTPLLVSSDLERGFGQQASGATLFTSNMAIAATQDTSLAYKQGHITGSEALSVGIHTIFAPVMDVNNNPENPIINLRAYSDDPQVVSDFGVAFINGIQDAGAIACAKHFPGHGNTSTDSHTSLPTIPGDKTQLEKMELYPFQNAIDSDVKMIMVGHISVPGLDSSGTPSSQSEIISSEILKNKMGFNGILVTDGLEMGSITNMSSSGEACVKSIEAGSDILLLPVDVRKAINAIYDAVLSGRISEDRIDESVKKIWGVKLSLGILENRMTDWDAVEKNVGLSANKATSQLIANRSITLVKNDKSLVPLKPSKLKKITHLILSTDDSANDMLRILSKDISKMHRNVDKVVVDYKLDNKRIDSIIEDLKKSSVVVVSMLIRIRMDKGESTIDESHAHLLKRMKEESIKTIGISFGSPYLPSYESLDAYMCAYGYGSVSLRAAANALWGRSSIKGKLPITLNDKYKIGHGIEIKTRKFSFKDSSKEYNLESAWGIIDEAISSNVFPGAQIIVVQDDEIVAEKSFGKFSYDESSRDVSNSSIYDIASITKVLSVTPITMKLINQKKISLNHTLDQYYPSLRGDEKGDITIKHLLTHSSGLKPFIEFYRQDSTMQKERMIENILTLDLDFYPGERMQYSDLGIIILMDIIEYVSDSTLDDLCQRWIFDPIGMNNTSYNPSELIKSNIVPTEEDNYFRNRLLIGEVHDENAYLLDGVSGHAGIFSNANDLAKYAQLFLNGGTWLGNRIFPDNQVEDFTTRQNIPKGSDRAIGWDTPSRNGTSSAGDYFSDHSYGHLGFTGTSLWVDHSRKVIVVLLTNRVHPSRESKGMYSVRRAFHTEIMKAIL